jgi:hypothetical protein
VFVKVVEITCRVVEPVHRVGPYDIGVGSPSLEVGLQARLGQTSPSSAEILRSAMVSLAGRLVARHDGTMVADSVSYVAGSYHVRWSARLPPRQLPSVVALLASYVDAIDEEAHPMALRRLRGMAEALV